MSNLDYLKQLRPMYTTTVSPEEYDIDETFRTMVKMANKKCECFCSMDVGKVWGLYLAYKDLKKQFIERK